MLLRLDSESSSPHEGEADEYNMEIDKIFSASLKESRSLFGNSEYSVDTCATCLFFALAILIVSTTSITALRIGEKTSDASVCTAELNIDGTDVELVKMNLNLN